MSTDPWEALRAADDALDDILGYSGGAANALEDEYVVERALLARVTARSALSSHEAKEVEPGQRAHRIYDTAWLGPRLATERALDNQWKAIGYKARAAWAAVERALASPVQEGWVMVPREPTPEMLAAAGKYADHCAVHNYGGSPDAEGTWHAMIEASPSPPETREDTAR